MSAEAFGARYPAIWEAIQGSFTLGITTHHGLSHWQRVAEIGFYLAERTGADREVVELFAYLHDSRRENEGHDPEHGHRAAQFVRQLAAGGLLEIAGERLDRLCYACQHHNELMALSGDITVQTCWDADRLDLWRVGITPDPDFLYTAVVKQESVITRWQR